MDPEDEERIRNKRKREDEEDIIMLALIHYIHNDDLMEYNYWDVPKKLVHSNFGKGQGKMKRSRTLRERVDVSSSLSEKDLRGQTHMTTVEFKTLMAELMEFSSFKTFISESSVKSLLIENKVLLVFIWMVSYPKYALLTHQFGASEFIVKKNFDEILPVLAEFFGQFILERLSTDTTSALNDRILFVHDATITPIRRPRKQQERAYNGHYKCHGKLVHLLVDFDGRIVSMASNVDGRCHDSLFGTYNEPFREICQQSEGYALGDSGFAGVSYSVSGFKTNQLKSEQHKVFDKVTRSEQIVVEHVNCFIKKCKCLSKEGKFIHSHETLALLSLIICGWYNWRREKGFICSENT